MSKFESVPKSIKALYLPHQVSSRSIILNEKYNPHCPHSAFIGMDKLKHLELSELPSQNAIMGQNHDGDYLQSDAKRFGSSE